MCARADIKPGTEKQKRAHRSERRERSAAASAGQVRQSVTVHQTITYKNIVYTHLQLATLSTVCTQSTQSAQSTACTHSTNSPHAAYREEWQHAKKSRHRYIYIQIQHAKKNKTQGIHRYGHRYTDTAPSAASPVENVKTEKKKREKSRRTSQEDISLRFWAFPCGPIGFIWSNTNTTPVVRFRYGLVWIGSGFGSMLRQRYTTFLGGFFTYFSGESRSDIR